MCSLLGAALEAHTKHYHTKFDAHNLMILSAFLISFATKFCIPSSSIPVVRVLYPV
mgnify:CR=1 FL=1